MSDTCTAGWCADADWCSVTCAAAVLDGKWHPVVVHRLLSDGPQGFAALSAVDGLSNRVLSDTLDDLRDEGVVSRRVVSEEPFRVEYALTEKGAALEPVVAAMADWGRDYA
ncbi:winged helix-turn-helix transcriptional regulator [Halorarius halobius]|uniref:winged helix-turn-helix transcriptional regulator n=1 Tax=Halorarius halobius TaxID=2962671 RepID=UPI0020CEB739|nr:helix-turn-helix domain-containing protein [Halorarius halobius]